MDENTRKPTEGVEDPLATSKEKQGKTDKKQSPAKKRAQAQADREEWSQVRIDEAFAEAGGIPKGTNPEEPPPRRSPGRPSKIDDIDLEWVQRLAAGGLTKREIAEAVGIGVSTLSVYQSEYPDFLAAIERGRARDIQDIEDALHRAAKGFTFVEEKVQYDTQIGKWARTTGIKQAVPDTKAGLAILQHAETGSWKPKTETELKFPEPLIIKSLSTGSPIESLGIEESKK